MRKPVRVRASEVRRISGSSHRIEPGARRSVNRALTLAVGASLALTAVPASAEHPRFGDRLSFSIGGMEHRSDGSVSSTRETLPLDRLTFADLGLGDDTGIGWAKFDWQFAEAWKFSLTYTSFDAAGFNSASESGNYDATEWEIGASLTSNLKMEFFIIDMNWDFFRTEKGRLGVGGGIHAADFDFDLLVEVSGTIGGESGGDLVEVGREETSELAPLPNLSLGGGYRLAENVFADARIGWLSLSYDRYEGRLFSARSAVEWRAWKNVGFGVAYQFVDIEVDVEGSRSDERYELEFYGPILFVSAGFR